MMMINKGIFTHMPMSVNDKALKFVLLCESLFYPLVHTPTGTVHQWLHPQGVT